MWRRIFARLRPRTLKKVSFSRSLRLEQLESRIAPVLGANALAGIVPAGGDLDHVVEVLSNGTGALLRDTQGSILTAAHVLTGQQGNILFQMARRNLPVPINIPVPADPQFNQFQIRDPGFLPARLAVVPRDAGIIRLTDPQAPKPDTLLIAPVGLNNLRGYTLFAGNPIHQDFALVGYGQTGTGLLGNADDAVQRITITKIPNGGGDFSLTFFHPAGGQQTTFGISTKDLTAAKLAKALETLPALAPAGNVHQVVVNQEQAQQANSLVFTIRFINALGSQPIAKMDTNVVVGGGAGQSHHSFSKLAAPRRISSRKSRSQPAWRRLHLIPPFWGCRLTRV